MKFKEKLNHEFKTNWLLHITHPVYSLVRVAEITGTSMGRKLGELIGDSSVPYPTRNDVINEMSSAVLGYFMQLGATALLTYELTKSIPATIGGVAGQIGLSYLAGHIGEKLNGINSKEAHERFMQGLEQICEEERK